MNALGVFATIFILCASVAAGEAKLSPVGNRDARHTVQVKIVGPNKAAVEAKLLVSSASARTSISEKLLKKIGVNFDGWTENKVEGPHADKTTKIGRITSITVAGQVIESPRVILKTSKNTNYDGTLGHDILSQFEVEIVGNLLRLRRPDESTEETWRVVMYWDMETGAPSDTNWKKLTTGIKTNLKEKGVSLNISKIDEDKKPYARLLLRLPGLVANKDEKAWRNPYLLRFHVGAPPFTGAELPLSGATTKTTVNRAFEVGSVSDPLRILPRGGGIALLGNEVSTSWRVEIPRARAPLRDPKTGLTRVTLTGGSEPLIRNVIIDEDISPDILKLVRVKQFKFNFKHPRDATNITKWLTEKGKKTGQIGISKIPIMFIPTSALIIEFEVGLTFYFELPHGSQAYFATTAGSGPKGGAVTISDKWEACEVTTAAKFEKSRKRPPRQGLSAHLGEILHIAGGVPNVVVLQRAGGVTNVWLYDSVAKETVDVTSDVSDAWKEAAWTKATGG